MEAESLGKETRGPQRWAMARTGDCVYVLKVSLGHGCVCVCVRVYSHIDCCFIRVWKNLQRRKDLNYRLEVRQVRLWELWEGTAPPVLGSP